MAAYIKTINQLQGWYYVEDVSRRQPWQEPIKQDRNSGQLFWSFLRLISLCNASPEKTNINCKWPVHYIQLFRETSSYNGEKLTRQCWKLLWVMAVLTVAWMNIKVFKRSLLLNHLERQSNKTKLLLPIMPIDIVACAFTLFWDNLCRNSCIQSIFYNNTS